jgi:SAM-dependent methyltransferase
MAVPGADGHSSRSPMGSIRAATTRLGRPVHRILRGQKVALFFQFLGDSAKGRLLDLGGGTGVDSEFVPLYQAFREVVVVNLTPPPPDLLTLPNVIHEQADGCCLPYESKAFDWVFSNAVIEHVGSEEKQRQFANQIRRVAKHGYFVTTPNKRFPIEPHTMLPFYQFLSESWQRRVARFSPYYLRQWEDIRMLTARQLGEFFPEAKVVSLGFPVVGTSLVAMHRD